MLWIRNFRLDPDPGQRLAIFYINCGAGIVRTYYTKVLVRTQNLKRFFCKIFYMVFFPPFKNTAGTTKTGSGFCTVECWNWNTFYLSYYVNQAISEEFVVRYRCCSYICAACWNWNVISPSYCSMQPWNIFFLSTNIDKNPGIFVYLCRF